MIYRRRRLAGEKGRADGDAWRDGNTGQPALDRSGLTRPYA